MWGVIKQCDDEGLIYTVAIRPDKSVFIHSNVNFEIAGVEVIEA